MLMPALDDTIIAVSSGWQASPLGIVRLSGPDAFELLRHVGVVAPPSGTRPRPRWFDATLVLPGDLALPATVLAFYAPRSYTSQDIAEIHTVGNLPALRAIAARLIDGGARRALPGEFTARAFLNGRLDARQVDGVLALINAEDESSARQAVRLGRQSFQALLPKLNERLTELIALVEAGIDFVEEEDVRFITPAELTWSIDALLDEIGAPRRPGPALARAGKPHVALAGLPNAGKSTLFNALLGYERAIVTPVLGTTRDVLSAEIEAGGVALVLQDCAGLGTAADELESAAHLAAEQAADQADLVLWVHDCTARFDAREMEVCRRIPEDRRLLVLSKTDQLLSEAPRNAPLKFRDTVHLSALTHAGLGRLRKALAQCFATLGDAPSGGLLAEHLGAVSSALRRARGATDVAGDSLALPEVVASELRSAWEALGLMDRGPLVEDVLATILARFCIGK